MTFPPDVVDAICAHMNDDHPEDCLVIVRALAGHADATAAVMVDLDGRGVAFRVTVPGGRTVRARVHFAEPVVDRGQIRLQVVRMYHDACRTLGVAPRPAEEH